MLPAILGALGGSGGIGSALGLAGGESAGAAIGQSLLSGLAGGGGSQSPIVRHNPDLDAAFGVETTTVPPPLTYPGNQTGVVPPSGQALYPPQPYTSPVSSMPPPLPPRRPTAAMPLPDPSGAVGNLSGGLTVGIGDVQSKFTAFKGAVGQAAAPLKEVTGGMGKFRDVVGKVGQPFKELASTMGAIPNEILSVKDAFVGMATSWLNLLASPIDTVNQLGGAIGRFVKLSNPGLVDRFTMRIEDGLASLGRAMEPLMVVMIDAATRVGDEFARLRPALAEGFKELGNVTTAVVDSMIPAFKEMAPLVLIQAKLWGVMATALQKTGAPLLKMVGMLERLGLYAGARAGYDPNQDSLGAAVRQHRVETSADALQRDAASKALSAQGQQEKKDPAVQAVTVLDGIKMLLEEWKQDLKLEALKTGFKEVIRELLPERGAGGAGAVAAAATGSAGPGGSFAGSLADLLRSQMIR